MKTLKDLPDIFLESEIGYVDAIFYESLKTRMCEFWYEM